MEELRRLRQLARKTQIRLSLEAGVPRQKIQLAETGQGQLTQEEERRIRSVLLRELQRQVAAINQALSQEQQAEVRV